MAERFGQASEGEPLIRPGPKLRLMWKRLTVVWVLVHGDARRLWYALRHPAAPRWLKPGTALLLLYLLSPLDLVPDALPVIGIVDDLVLLPLAVRWMLSMLPASLRGDIDKRFGTAAASSRSTRQAGAGAGRHHLPRRQRERARVRRGRR